MDHYLYDCSKIIQSKCFILNQIHSMKNSFQKYARFRVLPIIAILNIQRNMFYLCNFVFPNHFCIHQVICSFKSLQIVSCRHNAVLYCWYGNNVNSFIGSKSIKVSSRSQKARSKMTRITGSVYLIFKDQKDIHVSILFMG